MSAYAIQVAGLSKRFRLGRRGFDARALLYRLRGRRNPPDESRRHLWALRDVSFDVRPGECLGVVGRNGAGKSTLLKVLSRITPPTAGSARLEGKVGSLLEVGTGFHPELTGRENIFLNGAILGMRQRQIRHHFDEIVDFSGIERFLDTPVKRYSNGMFVRLAFAVAAYLQPEILIVDEVLAVGDVAFQHKCLGRMQSLAESGRTVLFVSHNMAAINYFCRRAIRLADGQLIEDGPAETVTAHYIADSYAAERHCTYDAEPHRAMQVRAVTVNGLPDGPGGVLCRTRPFEVVVTYDVNEPVSGASVNVLIERPDGILVCHTRDTDTTEAAQLRREPGRYTARVEFPGNLLNAGRLLVRVRLDAGGRQVFDERTAVGFELIDDSGEIAARTHCLARGGVLYLDLPWATSPSDSPIASAAPAAVS